MKYRIGSYRCGVQLLRTSELWSELVTTLSDLSTGSIARLRAARQAQHEESAARRGSLPAVAGVQAGIQDSIRKSLVGLSWREDVAVCPVDAGASLGDFQIDYHKWDDKEKLGVGVEVMFHHGQALSGPLTRLTIGNVEGKNNPLARVDVGAIIIPTESLKGMDLQEPRTDRAVGSFERLTELLHHTSGIFEVPLVLFGLEWSDDPNIESIEEI
jgi:hypothetical protein